MTPENTKSAGSNRPRGKCRLCHRKADIRYRRTLKGAKARRLWKESLAGITSLTKCAIKDEAKRRGGRGVQGH
jgi:hypothetical protein